QRESAWEDRPKLRRGSQLIDVDVGFHDLEARQADTDVILFVAPPLLAFLPLPDVLEGRLIAEAGIRGLDAIQVGSKQQPIGHSSGRSVLPASPYRSGVQNIPHDAVASVSAVRPVHVSQVAGVNAVVQHLVEAVHEY